MGNIKNQVAETILQQLGGRRFIAMTGAKKLLASNDSLSFRIGRNATQTNYVKIEYDYGKDLYSMSFSYVANNKGEITTKELKRLEGVYCDQLTEIFTDFTGLYTSL